MKKVYYSLMSYLPSPRAKHIINNNYLIQTFLKAIYNREPSRFITYAAHCLAWLSYGKRLRPRQ